MKYLVLFIAVLVLVTGCASPVGPHPAAGVVEEMYAALDAGDMDRYMDTLLPENRRRPNPLGLLSSLEIFIGPLSFNTGLSDISFSEVEVSLVQVEGDYALVQAEGALRITRLLWELPFCDQHDLRLVDGQWYIDVYAPEREARMQQVMEARLQELEAKPPATTDDLEGLFEGLNEASEIMMNLCP